MSQFVISPYDAGDNDIRPSVVRLPNGNVVVAYEHYDAGGNLSIAVRVIGPDGTPVTAETLFTDLGDYAVFPRLVAIDNDSFALVVSDFANSGAVELTANVFTLAGSSLSHAGSLPITDPAMGTDDNGNDHQILRMADGNYLVVWAQYTNNFANAQLTARTFDADFNPLTPETRISEFANTGVSRPMVTLDGNTVVVAWDQNDPTTGGSIHSRLATFSVGAGGTLPASPPNDLDVGANTSLRAVQHLANGDVLVLFTGGPVQGGALDDNDKLNGRIYSPDLTTVKSNFLVNPTVDDNGVSNVSVVARADGGFRIIWGQDPTGGTAPSSDFELFTRRYDADYVAGSVEQLTSNSVNEYNPAAVAHPDGTITLVWEVQNATGGGSIVGLYLDYRPTALADTDSVMQRLTETGDLLANDTDYNGATGDLSISLIRAGGGSDTAVSAGAPTVVTGAYGDLTINADGTYNYYANAETLLVGQVVTDTFTYTVLDPGNGTASATLTITVTGSPTGDANANTITGTSAGETLDGGAGDDVLTGNGGDDILIGGLGADQMSGGLGDDTYYVRDSADTVAELDNEGVDLVYTTVTVNLANFGAVENATLTGTLDRNIYGNDLDNILTGNDGDNRLTGWAGTDWLTGGLGSDTLIGGLDDDLLFGDEGDDLLNGSEGADYMSGGTGDDTYYVDSSGDVILEDDGEGVDHVFSTTTFYLGMGEIENGTLLGRLDRSLYGNDLDNVLTGNSGNNVLDGGKGGDTLVGGLGDDSYWIDSTRDSIVELANEGIDTVRSTISFNLDGTNIENAYLIGTLSRNLIGSSADNILKGNHADNILGGKDGADELWGLRGVDTFDYNNISESNATTMDVIMDLEAQDIINLAGVDANTTIAANQAFTLVSAFSNQAGELRLEYVAGDAATYLLGDTDGDGTADLVVKIMGDHSSFTNFVL